MRKRKEIRIYYDFYEKNELIRSLIPAYQLLPSKVINSDLDEILMILIRICDVAIENFKFNFFPCIIIVYANGNN